MKKNKIFISLIIFHILISCTDAYLPKANRVYVPGEIVKISYLNGGSVQVKYKVGNGKELIGQSIDKLDKVRIGEKYWIAYDSTTTRVFSVFYTAPYVSDTSAYTHETAVIESIEYNERFNYNYVSFIYKKNKAYRRYQRVPSNNLKIGDKVNILVNRETPSISYIKGYSKIVN